MGIVRVEKKQNFVIMDKTGLEDPRLSFKAKGILAYLLSKPDNWYCYSKHLAKVGPDGISAVKTGLRELREAGYLEKRPIKGEDGRIVKWESIIREQPKCPAGRETDQKAENPPSGKPNDRKTGPLNKYLNLISNDKFEEEEAPALQEIGKRYRQLFNRDLSVEFLEKLLSVYPDTDIILKALEVAEGRGDKPIYLLKILADWKHKGLKTVEDIDDYLDKRKANNGSYRPEIGDLNDAAKKLHDVKEMEKQGWN